MYLQKNNGPLSNQVPVLAGGALALLKKLIAAPSFSGREEETAGMIRSYMQKQHMKTYRMDHNIWAFNKFYDKNKPTILLNSHYDTVRPNEGYSRNPYFPQVEDDKLYGLGSNDAGGCLVAMLAVFMHFYAQPDLTYNLCFAATAEEESSGLNGLKALLPKIGKIAFAIIGEPTQMKMATAEMGCMVLDCISIGTAGHAARNEGDNALYKALPDIQWFSTFRFPKESAFMGPVKMTVTEIRAGIQHNIIPQECHFTVDVRLSNCYSAEEVFAIIKRNTECLVQARPGILKPSRMDNLHPIVRAGLAVGLKTCSSPASSAQGWLQVPSLTIGPGNPARSHIANEYIFIDEISEGISTYIELLNSLLFCLIHNPEHNLTEF